MVARIFGGIGNQLFCYAAARRLALKNNVELILDNVSGFRYDKIYNRHYQLDHFHIPCRMATAFERMEPFSRLRRNIIRRFSQLYPFEGRSYILQEGVDFDSRLLEVIPHGVLQLEGYWQSEEYFGDVKSTIRSDLQIKPPDDPVNLDMARKINAHEAVAVHVRFFEDPGVNGNDNVFMGYYGRAVAEMEKRVSDAHYFVFSDKPEAARMKIPLPDDRITIVAHNKGDENAYADLWLMSRCSNFVIANSTFSWWGAWLSDNPNALVIAPGKEGEMGRSWGFKGLLPERWIKM
ncbi:alpha-1,2-fucosyltransferase [Chlorobium sp. KB01]|uniref:alpha-1,2-fucosyltransferase n=1 Tax=Chlorobium sp. KB01 TaxID=1917528 RepID=UPI0018EA2D2D|nr:alpha-1,2-fucosyltransferase [Chlorobium sp. KB01]